MRKFLEVALVEWHAKCGTVCHGCLLQWAPSFAHVLRLLCQLFLLAIVLPTGYRHYSSHCHASVVMSFKMVALGCTMGVA